ncbi:30S ribosomal protein S3 [Methanimicrococcus blatticola]|uniref:Small ribosomal subunit protein uS3 n=1 Tax=Methanimicrococcus blatticola TaxID=91560 RepID=A0A484F5A8_9EURY|nr:30S ribosomal protein S3 [Methanimicrococcus blatticola]MBZ3936271.1 30S ribosomal protein S3 [Methanimicrococcus blatticola]MCC2508274.1 30S ribosomal protein S3 [Methanimicrococcus blatticola]TDQ70271.1 SSU ribosomal protein S3P [Methanimicrococcus blatticola]
MAVEKKFVKDGYTKASLDEHFAKQLGRSGYGGMNMSRTPLGTQITIYSEKPGMVIGKAGKVIRKLTQDVVDIYGVDNPQIDAQEVKKSELNAQIMANRLASSIERGWYFRKAGTNTIRAVMAAGALGCEVIISGKLTGARARTEKFIDGYVKHSGHPAEQIVDTGYAVAVKKLGTLGCRVKIVQPGAVLPDAFKMKEGVVAAPEADDTVAAAETVAAPAAASEAAATETATEGAACEPETIVVEEVTVTEVVNEEGTVEAVEVVETVTEVEVCAEGDAGNDDEIVVEDSDINEIRRLVDGVWQHKHNEYDYWHPMARVHKEAKK